VALNHEKLALAGNKRCKELAQLLGISEVDTADRSLSGRLKIIAKLKAARRVEIARGRAGSWLYDVNRHLNLCAALRREYEALAAYFAESAGENWIAEEDNALAPGEARKPQR
jgi:hypothetical protein